MGRVRIQNKKLKEEKNVKHKTDKDLEKRISDLEKTVEQLVKELGKKNGK